MENLAVLKSAIEANMSAKSAKQKNKTRWKIKPQQAVRYLPIVMSLSNGRSRFAHGTHDSVNLSFQHTCRSDHAIIDWQKQSARIYIIAKAFI